jgi:hypothetical protein
MILHLNENIGMPLENTEMLSLDVHGNNAFMVLNRLSVFTLLSWN